jgi:hypothetical protein
MVMQRAYAVVDELHAEHPELTKDQYFDKVMPESRSYSKDHDMEGSMPDITQQTAAPHTGNGHARFGTSAANHPHTAAPQVNETLRSKWRKVSLLQRFIAGPTHAPQDYSTSTFSPQIENDTEQVN